jgi:hypothetical protein
MQAQACAKTCILAHEDCVHAFGWRDFRSHWDSLSLLLFHAWLSGCTGPLLLCPGHSAEWLCKEHLHAVSRVHYVRRFSAFLPYVYQWGLHAAGLTWPHCHGNYSISISSSASWEGVVGHSARVVRKRGRVCGVPVTTISLRGAVYRQALGWKHSKMPKAQGVTIL